MKKYLFMQRALAVISQGHLFTSIVASALRVFAVLLSLGALVAWLRMWKLVFNMNGAAILGGALFQAFFVIGVYMVIHTWWIRAEDIRALRGSEFTVIPILSVLLRMLGETYACVSLTLGVGGGVAALFGAHLGNRIAWFLPGVSLPQFLLVGLLGGSENSFISAVLLAVGGAIAAVFWLFLFYCASEILVALVAVARNTAALLRIAERQTQSGENS